MPHGLNAPFPSELHPRRGKAVAVLTRSALHDAVLEALKVAFCQHSDLQAAHNMSILRIDRTIKTLETEFHTQIVVCLLSRTQLLCTGIT